MTDRQAKAADYEVSVDARTMQFVVAPRRPAAFLDVEPPNRCRHHTEPTLRRGVQLLARDFRRARLDVQASALLDAVATLQPDNHKDRR